MGDPVLAQNSDLLSSSPTQHSAGYHFARDDEAMK